LSVRRRRDQPRRTTGAHPGTPRRLGGQCRHHAQRGSTVTGRPTGRRRAGPRL